jgi:hypothetical protein
MERIQVGDRVHWWTNPKHQGVIKGIYLTVCPFLVIWDDGKEDWHAGNHLGKVSKDDCSLNPAT